MNNLNHVKEEKNNNDSNYRFTFFNCISKQICAFQDLNLYKRTKLTKKTNTAWAFFNQSPPVPHSSCYKCGFLDMSITLAPPPLASRDLNKTEEHRWHSAGGNWNIVIGGTSSVQTANLNIFFLCSLRGSGVRHVGCTVIVVQSQCNLGFPIQS